MNYKLSPHQWVNLHADYLFNFAISRLNDEEQARDLVQETFLAALENRKSFMGISNERTWLTAILKNKITDVYRKKANGLQQVSIHVNDKDEAGFFNITDGHWIKEYGPKTIGIEDKDHLGNKELDMILKKCIQKLPALWMAVFTMKHIDDQTTSAICTELNVSSANFWVIIHRAKLNLRACLQKNWI